MLLAGIALPLLTLSHWIPAWAQVRLARAFVVPNDCLTRQPPRALFMPWRPQFSRQQQRRSQLLLRRKRIPCPIRAP